MANRISTEQLLELLRQPGLPEALGDDQHLRAWAARATTGQRPPRRRMARLALLAVSLAAVTTALHSQGTMGPARPELALVNGQAVTRSQVAEAAEQRFGLAMLETSVMAELLRQAAEKAGVAPTDADIEAGLERIRTEQFRGDTERFETWRRTAGHRDSVLRREVAAQLAAFRLRSRGVRLTEADLLTYHKEHRDRYARPESYLYRMIAVPWPQKNGARDTEAEALAKAKGVLNDIKRGESFEAVARAISEDPQAQRNGGRVGPQPAELLPPGFAPLFRDAKPGQVIDEPVRLGSWFVLLQFLSHDPAESGEFEQVRTQVEYDYLTDKLVPQGKFMADLARAAKVEIVEPRYAGHEVTGHWFSPSGIRVTGWLQSE